MNQTQRDFLIRKVQTIHNREIRGLKDKIPTEPSLNNYLIAAILNKTVKYQSMNSVKKSISERIHRLGNGTEIIKRQEGSYRNGYVEIDYMALEAKDLFVIPENYLGALKEYNEVKENIENQIKEHEATKETLELKIQIGSSKILDIFIEQVDDMGSLDLLNDSLNLKEGKVQPRLQRRT